MCLPGFSPVVALLLLICAPVLEGAEYRPGEVYFGSGKYIEYQPGTLPIVLTAPHGGSETPSDIATRTEGVVQKDVFTQELTRTIADEFARQTGGRPHLVICRLHRKKLDCNREVKEAAAGDPQAEKAWSEYHRFAEEALKAAVANSGKAFLIDVHGHGHPDVRVELGYQHSQKTLAQPDAAIDRIAATGTLRAVAEHSKLPYSALVRGVKSLGGLLEAQGFPCTPSPNRPTPNVPYFPGGYTMRRHAMSEKPVAGFQLEANRPGLRDTAGNRAKFAKALVGALKQYLGEQFGMELSSPKTESRRRK